MDWIGQHLLTLTIFIPVIGAGIILFMRESQRVIIRQVALVTSLITFLLSYFLFRGFQSTDAFQFVEQTPWIPLYGISYHVGIDGISLLLVMLTTFITPVTILSAFDTIQQRVKGFMVALLIMETGMIGVFAALDLFLFYIFWEAMLIPMYFLIGIWGGARRIYATLKFVLFTMFGSLLMLVGIFILLARTHAATGIFTLTFSDLAALSLPPGLQTWLFLAFALAFAVKVPLFPLHTWLPDAHVEAPTAGSVLLAAVLLKMGAYGFIRLAMPLFPDAVEAFLPALSILALVGIIYGGFMALIQKDMKSLVAYSSVSHMGLVMLAVFSLNAEGLQGGVYQMINHGLSTGALFLCVGVLYERAHTRLIADFGGVGRHMPVYSAIFLISVLSSIGLPGLNGFVGEILCFFGIFASNKVMAALAVSTVILSAAYLLWLFRRVMQGPVSGDTISSWKDLSGRELAYFLPVLVLFFVLGLFPGIILRKTDATVEEYLRSLESKEATVTERRGSPAPPSLPVLPEGRVVRLPLAEEDVSHD